MTRINDTGDVGRVIREARRSQGYTQAQLAELSGISLTYVKAIEHGKPTAQIGKALRLLQLLSVDLDATRRGAGPQGQGVETLLQRLAGHAHDPAGRDAARGIAVPPPTDPRRVAKAPRPDAPPADGWDGRR